MFGLTAVLMVHVRAAAEPFRNMVTTTVPENPTEPVAARLSRVPAEGIGIAPVLSSVTVANRATHVRRIWRRRNKWRVRRTSCGASLPVVCTKRPITGERRGREQ